MSSKIILSIVLIILALLVGVGVYTSYANLNPLKDNKSFSTVQTSVVKNSISDLANHSSEKDCYVAVSNKAYDVSMYINMHPSGKDILKGCGKKLDGVQHPSGSFTGSQI